MGLCGFFHRCSVGIDLFWKVSKRPVHLITSRRVPRIVRSSYFLSSVVSSCLCSWSSFLMHAFYWSYSNAAGVLLRPPSMPTMSRCSHINCTFSSSITPVVRSTMIEHEVARLACSTWTMTIPSYGVFVLSRSVPHARHCSHALSSAWHGVLTRWWHLPLNSASNISSIPTQRRSLLWWPKQPHVSILLSTPCPRRPFVGNSVHAWRTPTG